MNKKEFLNSLKEQLTGLSEKDKQEILYDYEEHFTIGLSEGRTEEEIARRLGNPRTLSREIKANYMINRAETNASAGNIFNAIIATIALGFFNLIFVLGPFIGLVGGFIGIAAGGFAIFGSGIALFLAAIFKGMNITFLFTPLNPLLAIFVSIMLLALSVLWFIGTYYIGKWFYRLTIKYLKFNLNIISNRRGRNE